MGILTELLHGVPVVTREGDPRVLGPVAVVWLEERQAVSRAVPKRRHEYFATRHLARSALEQMGLAASAILNNPDRSPRWPDGVMGSLSHTDTWCGVALAQTPGQLRGLGIDLERQGSVSPEVARRILNERELACSTDQDVTARFSAKESYYKAIYPLVRRYVGFFEVEIELAPERSAFEVRIVSDDLRSQLRGVSAEGRFATTTQLCCTALLLR